MFNNSARGGDDFGIMMALDDLSIPLMSNIPKTIIWNAALRVNVPVSKLYSPGHGWRNLLSIAYHVYPNPIHTWYHLGWVIKVPDNIFEVERFYGSAGYHEFKW